MDLHALDQYIKDQELTSGNIKPDNEARIVWHQNRVQKTEYSVVYLHGFSASQGEGEPLHRNFADKIGANLYLSRLFGHGKSQDVFTDISLQNYLQSALNAVEIGKKLGKKCIVMGTSAGGLLALYLAAHFSGIHALYLYSPLVDFRQSAALILKDKLINKFAGLFFPGHTLHRKKNANPEISNYWYQKYPLKGVLILTDMLIQFAKPEIFKNVTQPAFMGYYYKNNIQQDPTVSVSAMLKMFDALGTKDHFKKKVCYPEADYHVITSLLISPVYQEVLDDSLRFFYDVINPQG